ncbi:hypothetical protein LINPERPRIM_LOCUS4300, partial [Linum perenne]
FSTSINIVVFRTKTNHHTEQARKSNFKDSTTTTKKGLVIYLRHLLRFGHLLRNLGPPHLTAAPDLPPTQSTAATPSPSSH